MTTPIYQVTANGADITGVIAKRLVSLTVRDEAGIASDQVTIVLDDADGRIVLPPKKTELSVSIGTKASGLVPMGIFYVDELNLKGPLRQLSITAKALKVQEALKAPTTRSWDAVTLGEIAASIAAKHGTTARVAPALAAIQFPHVDQTESDLHLLSRLARENGGMFKPANGQLVIVERGRAKTASGKDMPAVTIPFEELVDWDVIIGDRGRYGAVQAEYHDHGSAARHTVTVGSGTPVYRLRNAHRDKADAAAGASAKLASLNRSGATIRATTKGHPHVRAETPIEVTGTGDGVDGRWIVSSVEHEVTGGSDYQTRLDGEAPS